MPVVNPAARELVFKVVYYGPGLGGKTTSLQHIHATTSAEHRGKMVSLATPVDRTLYFDFLPIRLPASRDMTVRLQLFTVPGQVYYNATRKLVLTGADGVVFVVDSQRARSDANIESLRNLEENLVEHGRSLDEIPHVFSYNKRDLPGLVPIDDMERMFNPRGAPSFATVATSGDGVYETLEAITRAVLEDFDHRMPEHHGLGSSQLMLPEGGLAEALRMAEDPPVLGRIGSKRPAAVSARAAQEIGLSLSPADDIGERAARVLAEPGSRSGRAVTDSDAPIELLRAKRPSPNSAVREMVPELSPEAAPDLSADDLASPVSTMSKVVAALSGGLGRPASEFERVENTGGLESRIDTRTMISDAAPAVASEPSAARAGMPADISVPAPGPAAPILGFSLSSLWPDAERDTVVRVEEAIQSSELRDAVLLVDVLVQRTLEALATELGRPAPEPTTMMLMLGMHGGSVLEFRTLCERARATPSFPSADEAKTALVFATNLRLLTRHARSPKTER
jgi:mutual gliding-motility protein MglA